MVKGGIRENLLGAGDITMYCGIKRDDGTSSLGYIMLTINAWGSPPLAPPPPWSLFYKCSLSIVPPSPSSPSLSPPHLASSVLDQ